MHNYLPVVVFLVVAGTVVDILKAEVVDFLFKPCKTAKNIKQLFN